MIDRSPKGSTIKRLKVEADASAVQRPQLPNPDSPDSKSYGNTPRSLSGSRRLEQTDKRKKLSKAFPPTSPHQADELNDGETFFKLVDQEDDIEDRGRGMGPFESNLIPVGLAEKTSPSGLLGAGVVRAEERLDEQRGRSGKSSDRGAASEQLLLAKPKQQLKSFTPQQKKPNAVVPLNKQQPEKPRTESPLKVMTEAQRRWDLFRDHCDSIRASRQ